MDKKNLSLYSRNLFANYKVSVCALREKLKPQVFVNCKFIKSRRGILNGSFWLVQSIRISIQKQNMAFLCLIPIFRNKLNSIDFLSKLHDS